MNFWSSCAYVCAVWNSWDRQREYLSISSRFAKIADYLPSVIQERLLIIAYIPVTTNYPTSKALHPIRIGLQDVLILGAKWNSPI